MIFRVLVLFVAASLTVRVAVVEEGFAVIFIGSTQTAMILVDLGMNPAGRTASIQMELTDLDPILAELCELKAPGHVNRVELYDHQNDPVEFTNLAFSPVSDDIIKRLETLLWASGKALSEFVFARIEIPRNSEARKSVSHDQPSVA